MDNYTQYLSGAFIELYATIDGDRRYIPMTTGDVHIDAQQGTVEFAIMVDDSFEGLYGAGLVDGDGELTCIEEYDAFEIEFYPFAGEDVSLHARYRARYPTVEADITIPIVGDLSKASVVVDPEGRARFEQADDDTEDDVTFEPEDIPEAEPY